MVFSTSAFGQVGISLKKLTELCPEEGSSVPCTMYLMGFVRGFYAGKGPLPTLATGKELDFCLPSGVSGNQVAAVVAKDLNKAARENPELWHERSFEFVLVSLVSHFPCR